jgi:hypothetical protein
MELEEEVRVAATPMRVITTQATATVALYVYVATSSDTLSLELVRKRQAVLDAVLAHGLSRPGYTCSVVRVSQETELMSKWAALRIDIELAGYENA